MKNFKLKLNFLLNLFKKNKIFKQFNNIFEHTKNLLKTQNIKKEILDIYNKFYVKKFKINYLIFFFSLALFSYLVYLSFPGIMYNKTDQNYLSQFYTSKENQIILND